jgi:DNA invertase Pin-like site-specific DNA recombinase
MDRLARNLDDLRRIVRSLTDRGIRIEFVKEQLTFTGEDSPMATLLLLVMGAFAEFERSLIRERQRGVYRGRKRALAAEAVAELRRRIAAGRRRRTLPAISAPRARRSTNTCGRRADLPQRRCARRVCAGCILRPRCVRHNPCAAIT